MKKQIISIIIFFSIFHCNHVIYSDVLIEQTLSPKSRVAILKDFIKTKRGQEIYHLLTYKYKGLYSLKDLAYDLGLKSKRPDKSKIFNKFSVKLEQLISEMNGYNKYHNLPLVSMPLDARKKEGVIKVIAALRALHGRASRVEISKITGIDVRRINELIPLINFQKLNYNLSLQKQPLVYPLINHRTKRIQSNILKNLFLVGGIATLTQIEEMTGVFRGDIPSFVSQEYLDEINQVLKKANQYELKICNAQYKWKPENKTPLILKQAIKNLRDTYSAYLSGNKHQQEFEKITVQEIYNYFINFFITSNYQHNENIALIFREVINIVLDSEAKLKIYLTHSKEDRSNGYHSYVLKNYFFILVKRAFNLSLNAIWEKNYDVFKDNLEKIILESMSKQGLKIMNKLENYPLAKINVQKKYEAVLLQMKHGIEMPSYNINVLKKSA